jgi:DNA-binding CsgD family transcriptional regulator
MEQIRFAEYVSRSGLSIREQEIFALILQGMSNAEIAGALYITESTVKFHVGHIFKKTGTTNRSELIADYKLGNKFTMDNNG